tara:strand:- start:9 stop:221 length:213 start_codon:yes stop_codon:yes gene_type:complete
MTLITKGMGAIIKKPLKGTGKKTKGYMEKDPNVRKGIAMGLKSMKKKGFIGIKKKKIPHDLTHLKGILSK